MPWPAVRASRSPETRRDLLHRGEGLTGLALLAPSGFVVMGAIFGGSTLATITARRQEAVSSPMVPSFLSH